MVVLWVGVEFELSGISGGARFVGRWRVWIERDLRGGLLRGWGVESELSGISGGCSFMGGCAI